MTVRATEIADAISKQVALGLSVSELQSIAAKARMTQEAMFVDEWTWGREALQAAISDGIGELFMHAHRVGLPAKKALVQRAVLDSIDAVKMVQSLLPLRGDVRRAAEEFVRVLQRKRHDELASPRIGSPGTPVHRAMALAAAKIYAARTGNKIPYGGFGREHLLARLLAAISRDIGKVGALKPGHVKTLAPSKKSEI